MRAGREELSFDAHHLGEMKVGTRWSTTSHRPVDGSVSPSTLTRMDPGVLKLADPPLARANGPCRRSLGGKRGPWVIVLCQDRSRRRRWPKASLYKGLSPGPRSANRRPRWSVSSARMPKGDTPE